MLRQMERWLHQHIFKLGWLLTKDFHITTILYYTFFLPGVVLYECVIWLTAGILDVQAERVFQMPAKQEIGELKLNFVRISRRAHPIKMTIIQIMPLIVGLGVIWVIAFQILQIDEAIMQIDAPSIRVAAGSLGNLTLAADFWFWTYVAFTISNTMLPEPGVLRRLYWLLLLAGVVFALFLSLPVDETFADDVLYGYLFVFLQVLLAVFVTMTVLDFVGVLVLGMLESLAERITGDSATFENGRMVVMGRAEVVARRKRARERARGRQREQPAMQTGPPSVYNLALPVPGPPGREPISQQASSIVDPDAKPEVGGIPARPRREELNVVESVAEEAEIKINLPGRSRSEVGRSSEEKTSAEDGQRELEENAKEAVGILSKQPDSGDDEDQPSTDAESA